MLSFLINIARAAALPTFDQPDLPAFISSVYSFALTVVGIVVFIRILYAGFLLLTAAGNASKAGDAKNKIQSAVIGAILLFAAYLILYIINPDLVKNTFNFKLSPVGQSSPTSFGTPSVLSLRTSPTSGGATINILPGGQESASLFLTKPAHAHEEEGIFTFTVRVVDANSDSCEQTYTLEINSLVASESKLKQNYVSQQNTGKQFKTLVAKASDDCSVVRIGTQTLPNGFAGIPYRAEIIAGGGKMPYAYSVVDGNTPSGFFIQATSETPSLTIENLTAKRTPAHVFYQTDKFHLELGAAKPDSTVFFKWRKNGQTWYPRSGKLSIQNGWVDYGKTDSNGKWTNDAPFSPETPSSDQLGVWYMWVMVNGKISNVIGFEVVAPKIDIVTTLGGTPSTLFPGLGGLQSQAAFTPCTPRFVCENKATGEKSEPTLSEDEARQQFVAAGNPESNFRRQDDRCELNGDRAIHECVYPEQNPVDECRAFEYEWRNCAEELAKVTDSNGVVDNSKILNSETGQPVGKPSQLWQADQYYTDIPDGVDQKLGTKLVFCRYSDQDKAAHCNLPRSGETCLPANNGVGSNSRYCVPPIPFPSNP